MKMAMKNNDESIDCDGGCAWICQWLISFLCACIILKDVIVYGIIGDYPAPVFFNINPTNGQISLVYSLKLDDLKTINYTVREFKLSPQL